MNQLTVPEFELNQLMNQLTAPKFELNQLMNQLNSRGLLRIRIKSTQDSAKN